MPGRILDWSLFGVNGVPLTSGTTVDTGGVEVTFDFNEQDEGAFAANFNFAQYVAPGEDFDNTEGLKLFGEGGEGGIDDTSTTKLSFASTDRAFGDEVQDVAFRINDLDLGEAGNDYTDIVTIRAYDAEGNLVPVNLTPGSNILVSGDTATGNDPFGDVTSPQEPTTSLLVEIAGPVARIEIDYDNGGTDAQAIWLTDVHFETTPAGGNADPNAVGDRAETDEDTAVVIDLTGNDSDPDGDDVEILSVDTTGTAGTVTINPDNDRVEYDPNGQFEFLAPGETATDTFTYTVTDGNGGTDTATVTVRITGVNDDPDAMDDEVTPANAGTPVIVPVLDNDTDPEGDLLSVISVSDGSNGSVTNNGDGTVTYTPDPGFTGPDSFTYTVSDGNGGTDTATVTVNEPLNGPDGIVDGTAGDDFIATNPPSDPGYIYTGDPNGDLVDSNDALLPGEVGDDDIIRAGDGNDTVIAGNGDDEVTGGDGRDSVEGNDGDDEIDTSGSNPVIDHETFVGVPFETGADQRDDMDTVHGGDGNDTITTGDDADLITGGAGNDVIDAGIDDDTVDGGAGDDVINAGLGADSVLGGAGDDVINAGVDAFSDYVGDDPNLPNALLIDPATGDPALSDPNEDDGRDFVDGGAGNDVITTGDDDDTIIGGDGNDTINAGIDDDRITGNDGDDSIIGSHGSDTIVGGAGDDTIWGGFGTDPIPGTLGEEPDATDPVPENGRDLIDGGLGNDLIFGEDDDDTIDGGAGNDTIDGGVDDDSIRGRDGEDSLIGGQGNDSLAGGDDDDTLEGGDGDDLLRGQTGNDLGAGGDGDDEVRGGQGDDTLDGGAGNDSVRGDEGNDVLAGGAGNDTITGNDGNDEISGGDGDDVLFGGNGDDTISGGDGNDVLSGRADRDVFEDVGAGDTVDGGTGDSTADGVNDDFDTLDLSGLGPLRIVGETVDADGDSTSGIVEFLDGVGAVTGTLEFTEIENLIPCFTPGTAIATPRGECLVEELREGDRIITRDNGLQEIRWVGRRDLSGRELLQAPHLKPVLIRAGSLGQGLPERDMVVSPNHRMLMQGDRTALYFEDREVLAAAKHLTGLDGVDTVETSAISYIHFMFDQHEVVLSNGAWTESFQPGEQVLDGMGDAQKDEIYELFPELREAEGIEAYQAARRSLRKHEARLLID